MVHHLGFSPDLELGVGTLSDQNIQLVAALLKRLLSSPYELRVRDAGETRVRIMPPQAQVMPSDDEPLVRICLSESQTALLVISDPRYHEWVVSSGSDFCLVRDQDAYFWTPGREYLVHRTDDSTGRETRPAPRLQWVGDVAEVVL